MVVPHERRRGEAQPPPLGLQAPTDIDIVAGVDIHRVEATDCPQRVPPKSHVASGDVLRGPVVYHHVSGTARRPGDTLRQPRVVWRNDVWATAAHHVRLKERTNKVGQPTRVDPHVGVGIGDDLSVRLAKSDIAGCAQSAVRDVNNSDTWCRRKV